MATSEVQIGNLALTRLGERQIVSFDDGTKGADLCKLHYPMCRDFLLRMHPWNFATRRATLALDATTPNHEFDYRHALPTDCLKVIRTSFEADGFTDVEYRIEGRYLLVDEETVSIEYVAQVTDVTQFDGMFVDVLAQRLAAEMAMAITDNAALTKNAWDIYTAKLQEARTMDAQEGTPRDVIDANGWLTARV